MASVSLITEQTTVLCLIAFFTEFLGDYFRVDKRRNGDLGSRSFLRLYRSHTESSMKSIFDDMKSSHCIVCDNSSAFDLLCSQPRPS